MFRFREYVRTSSQAPFSSNRYAAPATITPGTGEVSRTPLPALNWVDRDEMWELICKKESGMYKRRPADHILTAHPAIHARMRAVLFDWLIEVCEVYRLHRETFYLAIDFIDRYLSKTQSIPKTRLQLIGKEYLSSSNRLFAFG
jgi:cyclin E